MPVRFTVDAYPGEIFRGKVAQIRLDAQSTQNVVLYTVVVAFDNSDLKLLPYLTANLQFEVEEHDDVLLVPNVALRWKPRPGASSAGIARRDRPHARQQVQGEAAESARAAETDSTTSPERRRSRPNR